MRKRQTFTWNVAFQPSLTETEQMEELMGLKEDIKIMIYLFFIFLFFSSSSECGTH